MAGLPTRRPRGVLRAVAADLAAVVARGLAVAAPLGLAAAVVAEVAAVAAAGENDGMR
jgi:hypothetical protein